MLRLVVPDPPRHSGDRVDGHSESGVVEDRGPTDSAAEVVTQRFTISDNVHEVFTVRMGAYSKTVYNRFGGSPVFDDARLGQTIDSIAGVSRWIGND